MSIDPEIFRDKLAQEFIKLLDSKRGIASELASAIRKDPSFVNGIKRNKPVNALHLKAVELIFGPEIVVNLLSQNSSIKPYQSGSMEPLQQPKEINDKFKTVNEGKDAINALLEIEKMDEQTFRRTVADLKYIADKLKEGAPPGPLIMVQGKKTQRDLKTKEKDNI